MSNRPTHALLVEDNPGDARLIRELLAEGTDGTFCLEQADRLASATRRAAQGGLDVVFLDLGLPDSQGLATFASFHAAFPRMPVVVLSGLHDEALAIDAVRQGAQDYLVKGQVYGNLLVRAARYAVERQRMDNGLQVSRECLEIVNRHTLPKSMLEELVRTLRAFTGVAAVGVRLLDEQGNIPYEAYEGFSASFYAAESRLSTQSDACMCIDVIQGKADPSRPFYTVGGSFYVNGTTRFLSALSEEDRGRTRNVCNQAGYESVALVPIRAEPGGRVLGLIHLADPREGMAPLETVGVVEGIATQLGMALHRARVDEALRKSEESNRLVAANMRDTVWLMDMDLVTTWISPSVVRMRGYTLDELAQMPLDKQMAPTSAQKVLGLMATHLTPESLADGQREIVISAELEFCRKDGTTFWGDTVATLLRDADGRPHGFLCVGRDIAERKQAEYELRRSEARFRSYFEMPLHGIAITSPEQGWIEVNATLCAMLGYAQEELRRMTWAEITHPDDLAADLEQFNRVLSGEIEQYKMDKRFVRKDGTPVWTTISIGCVRKPGGSVDYFVGAIDDITERIEAERRRARAEERLAQERYLVDTLMENTPDNIYFKDAEGRFIRINRALARYFRLDDPAQAVGKTDADFFGLEHAQQALADEQQILRSGKALVGKEEKETWPDGHVTYVSTTKAPLYDRAGAIVGTCGISRDITEHKHLEEQLRQAQKMEALGQLAGGVAHDFNNLLTVIQGNAQFALESLPMGCAERDEIGDVLKAAKSAGDLTRQLLAFSRRQVTEMRVLDLDSLLRGMGRMLGRILGESVTLEIHPAGRPAPIKADPGQIEQVVVNLCVNARDAMPGGGTLKLETTQMDLDQAFVDARPGLRPGRHVALTVSDTGCGMSPEVQARLFEPFFTTKGPGKGTGLGLATVYGIVQQSGGTIEVSSRVGKGSMFRIYLPCVGEAVATARDTGAQITRGSETVLVVDDDPVVQRMTARMLGDLGYRVLQAPHVADVLALCRVTTDPIHLLLTDVVMPGMSGPELLAQLRTQRPETRVLYMTGYTDDSVTRLGVLAEGVPLIQKPFTLQSLARKVRAALEGEGEGGAQGAVRRA